MRDKVIPSRELEDKHLAALHIGLVPGWTLQLFHMASNVD